MVVVPAVGEPSPFPFDRLERVPAAALGPLRAVARASRDSRGWGAALATLRTIVGADLHVGVVDVRWVEPSGLPELPDALAALRIELPSGVAIVELAPSAAVALVDAALGTAGDPAAFRPLRDAEQGVLAYLAARFVLAARPHAGRVLGWTTDPRALAVAIRRKPHVAIRLDLTLGGHVHAARLWLPGRGAALPERPLDLARLRDLPVRVRFEVGRVELPAEELALLHPGDVVLLDTAHARPEGGSLAGRVLLGVIGARAPRFTCTIADRCSVRIETLVADKEMVPMGQKENPAASDSSLGPLAAELPVELVVELGRTTLTVGAVSSLAPGEVVVLDRAPADPVTLTAGDRSIARGELVVVDGRVGVRILDVARR